MATVNFAANGFATTPVVYYLHSEHYEALFSKEKEQSLVKMRSCKIRKRRKTVWHPDNMTEKVYRKQIMNLCTVYLV